MGDLSRPQLRFKVDVNARENHLTGAAILADDFAMVVVEGGPKTLNRWAGDTFASCCPCEQGYVEFGASPLEFGSPT